VKPYSIGQDLKISKQRLNFIANGTINEPSVVRNEIIESWKRCRNMHVSVSPPNLKIDKTRIIHTDENVTAHLRTVLLQETNNAFYDILKIYHGAAFYLLYDSLIVYSQRGDKDLLDYFNINGLGIGACLEEINIGTTALSISPSSFDDAWVIGAEHYLGLFTPYLTYCYFGDYKYSGHKVKTMVILPKHLFSPLYLQYLRTYSESCKWKIVSYFLSIESQLKDVSYKQYEQEEPTGVLLIDIFGKIISMNQQFIQWTKVSQKQAFGKSYLNVFPELTQLSDLMISESPVQTKDITIWDPPIQVFVEIKSVYEYQKAIGKVLKFRKIEKNTGNQKVDLKARYTFADILGSSPAIQNAKKKAYEAASGKNIVILTGESGTGKELFAQSIHNASPVRKGPFVAVNCAAFSSELIVSELFGYVGGAFTGAKREGAKGKIEMANNGTLFLDEIGELTMTAQSMLLRVLEERKIVRLGSSEEIPVRIRLISATNRDLRELVREKLFRLDLFYRVFVNNIHLPALCERIEDLPILAQYFIEQYNIVYGKSVTTIEKKALERLIEHSWPGNIRELRNIIECGMSNAYHDELRVDDLPDLVELTIEEKQPSFDDNSMAAIEKEYGILEKKELITLMIRHKGNKTKIANALGVTRTTLYKKLKKYNLD